MEPTPSSSPYTQVIDLTSKAQREERDEQAKSEFPEPDPKLPEATPDALPASVRRAFGAAGWTSLMPVQEKAIPYIIEGRDLIVQSRTGSGKTGAFLLPLFDVLDAARSETQALILTPTRELAKQIHAEFERMKVGASQTEELRSALVYGGVQYRTQIQELKAGAHLVIGTPGRILDHLDRRTFSLKGLNVFILDEADEMLSMGFYPAMQTLKRYLPGKRQSYMFSATMPPKVRSLGQEFLHEPSFLGLSAGQVSVELIEHRYYRVNQMEKDRVLIRLIEMENPDSAIIFANTKREVEYLATFLDNYGYDVAEISGDLPQKAREKAMGRLREGELRFLVATDVAARGIDISDLSHVFQYDIPEDPEYYIHRTGRTARAGKAGTAIALATLTDERRLQSIARRYGFDLEKRDVPEPDEVSVRVSQRMVVVLEDLMRRKSNLERERWQRFIPMVEELVREEPELLAMLIDDLYHERMHVPQDPEASEEKTTSSSSDKASQADSGRSRRRKKR